MVWNSRKDENLARSGTIIRGDDGRQALCNCFSVARDHEQSVAVSLLSCSRQFKAADDDDDDDDDDEDDDDDDDDDDCNNRYLSYKQQQ
ncbi:unnamed protein product [Spodoptera exigua]|nr:unnamed protein product [Spodoptera exigua]